MKASTLVYLRRKAGPWCAHSHPESDERETLDMEIVRPTDNDLVRVWASVTHALIEGGRPPGKSPPAVHAEGGEATSGTPVQNATVRA